MKKYKDINGFLYSEDDINTAIKGSTISFDEYIDARGLKPYKFNPYTSGRGSAFDKKGPTMIRHPEFGTMEKSEYLKEHRPNLEVVALKYPQFDIANIKKEIQHGSMDGFLKKSKFVMMGGWGGGPGQETRVVDWLNDAYSQYDKIRFEEAVGGSDTVRMIISNDDGTDRYTNDYNLAYDQNENRRKFNEIKRHIKAYYDDEHNADEEVLQLAEEVETAMFNESQEVHVFGTESSMQDALQEVLPSTWKVEQADWYRDALIITNHHGVSRHFNLEAAHKAQIKDFILRNVQQTDEYIEAEMAFDKLIQEEYLTDEKVGKVHEHGPWYSSEEQYKSWEDLDTEADKDRFIDMIFDDMGIDQGFMYFDTDSALRDKFGLLTEEHMKVLIKNQLEGKSREIMKETINDRGGVIKGMYDEKVEEYYRGQGEHYKDGKWRSGSYSENEKISSAEEFIELFNYDAIKTADNQDLTLLGEANLRLMEGNLSTDDIKKWENQRKVALENLTGFVQYIDRQRYLADGSANPNFNKRVNVPRKQAEYFQAANPDYHSNESNLNVHRGDIEKKLTGDPKTDWELIKAGYEQNVWALMGMEHELNKSFSYKFDVHISTGEWDDDKGEMTYSTKVIKGKMKNRALRTGVYGGMTKAFGLADSRGSVKGFEGAKKGSYKHPGSGTIESISAHNIRIKDPETGEWLSKDDTQTYFEREEARYRTILDEHEVYKNMYLYNKDAVGTWGGEGRNLLQQAGALALGSLIGGDQYKKLYGYTDRDIVDMTPGVMSQLGHDLTGEQTVALDRDTWETIVESGSGSVGILLEFAIANKATAAIRAAKLFTGGTRSLNAIMTGWKAKRYNNGRIILTEAQILQRAGKLKMTPLNYMKKYKFAGNQVKNYLGNGTALLTESVIEGAKFASLPSSSGNRMDSFSTGFGFGFMGQVLAPVFGQITEASIVSKFGKKSPYWLLNNASKLNMAYQIGLKGPTSFVAGSELGEFTKELTKSILGSETAFSEYMDHMWGDYGEISKRLISNWVVGTAFGLSHHVFPKRINGKFEYFSDYRSLSDMESAKNEAFSKNYQRVDYLEVISPKGKKMKLSPEEFSKLYKQDSNWKVSEKSNYGGWELKNELQVKAGDSQIEIQRKKDLQTRNEEAYHVFDRMLTQAKGKHDLLDPIKGQMILEKAHKDATKFYKDHGIKSTIEWGNNETMGNKRAKEEYARDENGKIDKKKIKLTFNVEQISLGLMPHELGHAGMKVLFGENARFKGDFLHKLGNIAKKIELPGKTLDGRQMTLYDQMVERNGSWDVHNRAWENNRIAEWEMFSYVAEQLAEPRNYAKLKQSRAFTEFKGLLNNNLGKELNHTYDLKTEVEIVKFFGDYIESVNKGTNSLKVLNRLTDVIDISKTGETEALREAWESELKSPEAPTTTLESNARITELVTRNKKLFETSRDRENNKWKTKTAEREYQENVRLIEEQKQLAEKPKAYEKNRDNNEIVGENTRLVKVIEVLLKESGGTRVKHLPDGPIKDNLIMNLRANNIGVLPRIVLQTKNEAKANNVPKDEIPSDKELMGEAEIQMLQLIGNYNPKINPEFGAYIQSKDFGLMRKGGTILGKVRKGEVEGIKTSTDKLDIEGKFDYQKDFDLKGEYVENPNRLVLRNEMFKTGEPGKEKIDTKLQNEVIKEVESGFNKLATEQIVGLNFTNIRDFHNTFSGEKSHKIFTAISKSIIDKIIRNPETGKIDKPGHIGKNWDLLYRMMGENNVVSMSGVRAEKGAKGQEGRSIEIRERLLNAKNSKGEELFERTKKRTAEDATGSSIEIREKINIPINAKGQKMFLDHLSIEVIEFEVPQPDGSKVIDVKFQWKKGTTATQKLNADALLQEVYGRNFVAQEMVTWIKTNYKNKPELQQAMSEGQILGRLSGGSPKLFSENLNNLSVPNQHRFLEEIKTERFAIKLNDNRKRYGNTEEAIIKTLEDHFDWVGEKHSISKSEIKEIGKDLYKEFQNAPTVKQEMLIQKAVKTIEFTNKLENITGRSKGKDGKPLSIWEAAKEFGTEAGILRTQDVSRKIIKQLIKEEGIGIENVLATGEHGGAGVGVFRKTKIGEKITKLAWENMLAGTQKSGNRHAIYESAADFRKMIESVEIELLQEGLSKNADYEIKTKNVLQAESNRPGVKNEVFEEVGGNSDAWSQKGVDRINVSADINMKVLKRSSDILRDLYQKGEVDHNQVRSWVEMSFAGMRSLGKKSAGVALLPNMTPKEMKKLFGKEAEKYVLEHLTPAQYVKARMYDYILNGGNKKAALDLTLADYHTTILPKGLDKMVNELAKTDMPSSHLPGMDPMMRYYDMAHSSDFAFGFKNVMFGKNNLKQIYDFHPNLSIKQKQTREINLGEQYRKVLTKLGLNKGAGELNSENLNHLKNIEKALVEGRKAYKEKRGMSTWDFDDTLAFTKSGVRYTLPNPSGKPAPKKKVIFLAGGAGSGKSNVVKKLGLGKQGFKIVNQDISLEWLMKNHGLPKDMREFTQEQRSQFGSLSHQARGIALRKRMKFQGKGDGVIVDGTGASLNVMEKNVKEFKDKGYDVQMMFVETSKEVAVARNKARKERSLITKIVEKTWESVQGNKEAYKKLFGERFAEINTDNLKMEDAMPPELIAKLDAFTKGYIKARLNAGEYADKGAGLKEQGAEFDFSEFNTVTEGSKGPFFQKALKRAKKFGNKDMFVLTARPPEAQIPIYEFLKAQGLEIPLENIKGLGNSTGEAKALWMLEKFAEGYNDMYFADDAMKNVKAVRDVLDQLDVKSKVQQAKRYDKEIDPKIKEKASINDVKDANRLGSPETYDNILYSENHRAEYEKTIAKHRKDLVRSGLVSKSVDDMFVFVESLNIPEGKKRKYEKITTKWLATSSIKIIEDRFKITDAINLAEKYKEDIFSYRNPNEIIEKYAGKVKGKVVDPNKTKEFKYPTTYKKRGITVYEVDNSKEGQQAVRDVVDSHWGENSNPWCITQAKNGKLTEDAWLNWRAYEKGPKRIVFQDGKLSSFYANRQYWDRMDNATDGPSINLKDGRVTRKVELVDMGGGKIEEFVREIRTVSIDKKTVTTEIREDSQNGWDAGTKIVENRIDGITVKSTRYDSNGKLSEIINFDKSGKAVNNKTFQADGKIRAINQYGTPFGDMNILDIVTTKGDLIERVQEEGGEAYIHARVSLDARGLTRGRYDHPVTDIGWKMPENMDLKDMLTTSSSGEIRVDLKKVLKIDPDLRGLPNHFSKIIAGTKLYSENLSEEFNKILEETTGIGAEKTYSDAKGKLVGRKKWNVPIIKSWGAEDFMGLTTYAFSGKGKEGEAHQEFFRKHLEKPFSRAYNDIHARKQNISNDYKTLRKEFKEDVTDQLNEKVDDVFTVDQAIRVYNWNKSGFEIPGLSKTDLKTLTEFVSSDPNMTAFAENLRTITKLKDGYVKPKDYWLGENITMDMNNAVDRVYRKEALEEFTQNREAIFGKWENGKLVGPNMNKIEASLGPKHREALENILWRMEKGTNRVVGADSNTNKWMNWVNSATGTIMFFNQKSAVLQTISSLNYVNGTFNNPLRAAQSFANQPQYWKDFVKIFGSDMLLQRRSGLKINLEAAELMDRVGSGDGAFSKFRALILEKGFIPTKYADSFAIASGGATYYRNSIRKYKKQGMETKEAEAKAWEDFALMTEQTQQSSRPDLISMHQASALGRPILAFANTPMQMFRRHKRRIQDIASNRGNMVENVLSAAYYGFAQTVIFSFLSNAMFAVDDEATDIEGAAFAEKKKSRHINTIADSYLRGMGTGGASVAALKNGILTFIRENKKDHNADYANVVIDMLNVSPPIGSKARKLYSASKTWKYNKDVIGEMGFNLDNPGVLATANVISAITNIPTDRVVMKINNIRDASSSDFQGLQKIALLMGWNKWNLGAEGGPAAAAIKESQKRIQLQKKLEEYGVETEKEVIRIEKGKEIKSLNKNQQIKILKDLGYSDSQIKKMKKEENRVNNILLKYDKNNKKIDQLILTTPEDVKIKVKKKYNPYSYTPSSSGTKTKKRSFKTAYD